MNKRFLPSISLFITLVTLAVLAFTSLTGVQAGTNTGWAQADYAVFLPLVSKLAAPAPQEILVNHNNTDISQIPAYWISEAKKLTVHYARTSHGSQILTGLQYLEQVNPLYNIAIRDASQGIGLPADATALRFLDGNPPESYITPELYWASSYGITLTTNVASSALFKYSTWTWCGQQSWNSEATVNQYLSQMNTFESLFPSMRFILYTGHTDGDSGSYLMRNNNLVRSYAAAHAKVLFDFADIEQYDPAGVDHGNAGDSCPWCSAWCSAHPADCADFNLMSDCAHSHKLQCKLKAQAFWWLMARLAGWNGEP
jgi:hypothetical protein